MYLIVTQQFREAGLRSCRHEYGSLPLQTRYCALFDNRFQAGRLPGGNPKVIVSWKAGDRKVPASTGACDPRLEAQVAFQAGTPVPAPRSTAARFPTSCLTGREWISRPP